MKIAIVTDSYHPTRDGVVACIDVMKNVYDKVGIESEIIAPDPGDEKERRPGVHYFKSIKFKNYAGYFIPIYPSHAKKVIMATGADVVHIQGIALMALKGLIAAHRLGLPVIVTFHTMVGDTMKYYSPVKMPEKTGQKLVWKYLGYFTKWVDAIVAPSQSTADELRENGIKVEDMRIIPTPVDDKRFSPSVDGSRIREKYGLQDKRVIVCVGRVSFEKEIDLIIRAVATLDKDVSLLVVGKGPAMDSLKELSQELGMQDRVIFTGFVPDEELVEHYRAGDVATTASRFETQCLCALEAMSCGLPVACANARALADYVHEGENGYLFEKDVDSCASALNKALNAPQSVIDNGRATAAEFNEENFVRKMSQLYEDVVERKKRC